MGKTARKFLFRYKNVSKLLFGPSTKMSENNFVKVQFGLSKNVWKWTKKAWNCQKSENTISEIIFLTFLLFGETLWHFLLHQFSDMFCNLCKFSDIFVPVSWNLCYLWKCSDIFVFYWLPDIFVLVVFWNFCNLWICSDIFGPIFWHFFIPKILTFINSLHLLEISDPTGRLIWMDNLHIFSPH